MKKLAIVVFLFIVALNIHAGVLDQNLAQAVAYNPNGQFHVMAFFAEQLTPNQVIQQLGLNEDSSALSEVVNTYKTTHQNNFYWLNQFLSQESDVNGLTLHILAQGADFSAPGQVILDLAEQAEIGRIALFQNDLTKPDDFFLTPEYYQIRRIEVTSDNERFEVSLDGQPANTFESDTPSYRHYISSSKEIDPEQIINILKNFFDLIKEGKPVINTNIDQAAALPAGIAYPSQLTGWREQHSSQYIIRFENIVGMDLVYVVMRVHFYYNGSYQGIGKYITGATVSIDDGYVFWGWSVDASVKVPDYSIVNIGSSANPIAGMKMFVNWKASSSVQVYTGTFTFVLDGEGNLQYIK